jgi:hypothetical protein
VLAFLPFGQKIKNAEQGIKSGFAGKLFGLHRQFESALGILIADTDRSNKAPIQH